MDFAQDFLETTFFCNYQFFLLKLGETPKIIVVIKKIFQNIFLKNFSKNLNSC